MTDPNPAAGGNDLAATVALLWPGASLGGPDASSTARRILALPSADEPRWLVPLDARGALGAVLSRENHGQRRANRWARGVSAAWARNGLPTPGLGSAMTLLEVPSDGIETFLSSLLGQPVNVIVGIGTDRANRKPVLQVLDSQGTTLAYVKAGTDVSTRALVRREAATLSLPPLRTRRGLKVPGIIALETWGEIDLLVIEPLSHEGRRHHRDEFPLDAMRALAEMDAHTNTVADSAWFTRMRSAEAFIDDAAVADRFRTMLDDLERQVGGVTVTMGAWHGDWTPWNMSWVDDRVMLWDWERFDPDVPAGFDAVHYQIQDRLRRDGPSPSVVKFAVKRVPALLREFGNHDVDPDVVLGLYLAEITSRYLLAAQGAFGGSLRPMAAWTLDLSAEHWTSGGTA